MMEAEMNRMEKEAQRSVGIEALATKIIETYTTARRSDKEVADLSEVTRWMDRSERMALYQILREQPGLHTDHAEDIARVGPGFRMLRNKQVGPVSQAYMTLPDFDTYLALREDNNLNIAICPRFDLVAKMRFVDEDIDQLSERIWTVIDKKIEEAKVDPAYVWKVRDEEMEKMKMQLEKMPNFDYDGFRTKINHAFGERFPDALRRFDSSFLFDTDDRREGEINIDGMTIYISAINRLSKTANTYVRL